MLPTPLFLKKYIFYLIVHKICTYCTVLKHIVYYTYRMYCTLRTMNRRILSRPNQCLHKSGPFLSIEIQHWLIISVTMNEIFHLISIIYIRFTTFFHCLQQDIGCTSSIVPKTHLCVMHCVFFIELSKNTPNQAAGDELFVVHWLFCCWSIFYCILMSAMIICCIIGRI